MAETITNQANRLMNVYFRYDSPKPFQVLSKGDAIYMRWSTDDVGDIFILRVLTITNSLETVPETIIQTEFTIDKWTNREAATYQYWSE
jgi:hypothetical protein